ncbi:peptide MFS transporter [Clostridiaceae bacterium 68-1-5]|uniref:Peptide MFS transporter n=1 Tax=Suipraeoptans intestinalis TaxID=2606628 RepID=A0A6N7UT65_9FIRM|nr:MFS transporter [Suipraeoptans intestinalis]MSR94491.1 peptide MFS transporter [Suipraeoptans intestinalis]
MEKKQKYPVAFWVAGCTEIFERLSFYLGRSLILVFVTTAVAAGGLGLPDTTAASMQSDITAYSYLAGLVGAIIVDRFVGPFYTTPVGMLIISFGYFSGAAATSATGVYIMIFCVAFGLGLFKTGPMIGRIVKPEQLNSAYSIRYSLVNVGAFIGPFAAGILYQDVFAKGEVLGFRGCFRLAGIVMLLGCVWFTVGMILKGKGAGRRPFKHEKTKEELEREEREKAEKKNAPRQKMTTIEKKRISAIVLISAFQIVFWLFWYLAYLPIYYHWAENMNWSVGGLKIPVTWVDAVNALFCVISGPLTALLWQKLSARPQGDLSLFKKLGIGLSFLGVAYIYFAILDIARGGAKVSVLALILFMVFLTLGEMFFSPLGSAFIGLYSPSRYLSVMGAVWGLGIFAAAKLYGNVYSFAFGGKFAFPKACIGVAIVAFICTVVLFLMDNKLTSLVKKKDGEE